MKYIKIVNIREGQEIIFCQICKKVKTIHFFTLQLKINLLAADKFNLFLHFENSYMLNFFFFFRQDRFDNCLLPHLQQQGKSWEKYTVCEIPQVSRPKDYMLLMSQDYKCHLNSDASMLDLISQACEFETTPKPCFFSWTIKLIHSVPLYSGENEYLAPYYSISFISL